MTKLLLSLHVLAALLAIGPVAVAASMFPPALRRARAAPGDGAAVVAVLHRICRVYSLLGIAVPLLGLVTASVMGVLGDGWVIVSIVLTGCAAAVLVLLILPRQDELLDGLAAPATVSRSDSQVAVAGRTGARLAMHTGIFNLLWAIVTVLMIVRPGSSTGA